MTDEKDVYDENLERIMPHVPETEGPTEDFRSRILESTRAELSRRPRGRLVPKLGLGFGLAAAAAILFAVYLGPFFLPPGPGTGEEEARPVAEVRSAPAFETREQHSRLYLDPVAYLRKQGVDVTIEGLVRFWRETADGRARGIELARYATVDALSRRADDAFGPLLARLWDLDESAAGRKEVLRFLGRIRDRATAPWLDARIADAPATLLPTVAATRAGLARPDAVVAAALRSRIEALRLLDPGAPGFRVDRARKLLVALHDLGGRHVVEDAARILAAKPDPELLGFAWRLLGDREPPPALRSALDGLVAASLEAEDAGYDDLPLLVALSRAGDDRFVTLLEKVLSDSYAMLRADAARIAGMRGGADAARALRRSLSMAEDPEDPVPPLWALARCGDGKARGRLLSLLKATDDYRAARWTVDALLDLGAPAGEILLALPDDAFSLERLTLLLDRMDDRDRALGAKIAGLRDGVLRRALVLVRDVGYADDVRAWIETVAESGGSPARYLSWTSAASIETVLASPKASAHDVGMALEAVRALPDGAPAKLRLYGTGLAHRRAAVRIRAAGLLRGREGSAPLLAARLAREEDPVVREALARALAAVSPSIAASAVLAAVTDDRTIGAWSPSVSGAILPLLGAVEDDRALRVLESHLAAESVEIRVAAARGLRTRGDARGASVLTSMARGGDPVGSSLAHEALHASGMALPGGGSPTAGLLEIGYARIRGGEARRPSREEREGLFAYRELG